MKKFEELEKFQQELQDQKSHNIESHENSTLPTSYGPSNALLLNQEQLEELFKRTSGYTVKEAMMDTIDVLEHEYWIEERDEEER
jgi:hypothetical protein